MPNVVKPHSALLFEMTLGILSLFAAGGRLPEIIVAAVGHAREEGLQGLRKRTADALAHMEE